MCYHDYLSDALELVSAWDIDDEADFVRAVHEQARLMAGDDPMEDWEDAADVR